jgi:pimeloyl-ACP methyl ester carboxylesterase
MALAGLSLGGWVALAAAAARPAVRAVVAMAPLIDPRRQPLNAALADEFAQPLRGVAPDRLQREWNSLTPVAQLAPALTDRPVLLVTAGRDQLFPPGHYAGVQEWLPRMDWVTFPRADHLFSAVRPGLCHTVGTWLLDHLG